MKILLVADGRSPITRGWIKTLELAELETSLISTFPCEPLPGVRELRIIPAAFSALAGSQVNGRSSSHRSRTRGLVSRFRGWFLAGRYWLGPLSLPFSRNSCLKAINEIKPDVVHALRIPFEGMLARVTPPEIPFAVSIWGNDLTLHAQGSPLMAWETRRTLRRADGLMADAHRDLRLACEWGFHADLPTLCVPGGGGIDLPAMLAALKNESALTADIPAGTPVVINPRGFRPGSVRHDTFFKSIPLILKEEPQTIFLCAGMAGQPEALDWVERLGIARSVRLLPFLVQEELWRLFLRAQVSLSISQHDGTPNSLLESMALGCYPVAGDIESTREWIVDGENGRLVDPSDEIAAAQAVLEGLRSPALVEQAAAKNMGIIHERADRNSQYPAVHVFYTTVAGRGQGKGKNG
ncbi:MAG: glycosyltransferase [Leptolinea sp.]|jgi:hypothetical protein|nr:glycosyltransferase [Leptolinea sp.]